MPLDSHSLSPARLAANRANAQLSCGPKTPEGKAAVSQNRWRHGLTGEFMTLAWEREEDFEQLVADLRAEHQPSTPTEKLLVDNMAQHYWLLQRALSLQEPLLQLHPSEMQGGKTAGPLSALPDHPRTRLPQMPSRARKAQSRKKNRPGWL